MHLWPLLVPALVPLYGLVALHRGRPRWAAALGWLALWVLPAVGYQMLWGGTRYSMGLSGILVVAPVGLWVLLGGGTAVAIFEAVARDLTGHRDSTMVDNVHVYIVITALQCALFVAILQRRDRPYRRDRVAVAIGAGFLVNALAGASWPWWGT